MFINSEYHETIVTVIATQYFKHPRCSKVYQDWKSAAVKSECLSGTIKHANILKWLDIIKLELCEGPSLSKNQFQELVKVGAVSTVKDNVDLVCKHPCLQTASVLPCVSARSNHHIAYWSPP